MSTYISGGMIVGAHGSELKVPEDFDGSLNEWIEVNGMDIMSQRYDSGGDDDYYGFRVENTPVFDLFSESNWMYNVKKFAAEFYEITGVRASLIGCQDVT